MILPADILRAQILIVDDQAANLRLLEQVLAGAGYSAVRSTTDPTEVCALHREHHYDLILLDLQMPGMDGFAVLEGLKAIETESYVPVLVVTAQPGHKLRALQAGAKDFVSKPFDLTEIKTRIHNLLEVRLLYRALADHNRRLEQTVLDRTAALRASEERFQRLTELSSDWYWEQDAEGRYTDVSGPAIEMLGMGRAAETAANSEPARAGWNLYEQQALEALILARRPFLDFVCSRTTAEGVSQCFQVSGEPMFDASGRYTGYRGVGVEISNRPVTASGAR